MCLAPNHFRNKDIATCALYNIALVVHGPENLGREKKNDMALAGSMCAIFAPLRHIRIVYFADYFLGSRAMLLS